MSLASLGYNALRLSGVTTLARRLTSGGVLLCYHNVVADPDTADKLGLHMPLATFARQMRWLADHYAVVPLDEFVDRLLRGVSVRRLAAVTFDDGYVGVFEHAWPLLQSLGIPATVFVVANAPERYEDFWWDGPTHSRPWCRPAGWNTIVEAARTGLQIGAHTATHRSLPTLNDDDLRTEIVDSRQTIAQHTGATPAFFAYPFGLWNDRVRGAVRAAGFRGAFTLEADRDGPPVDAWALPRVTVPAGIEDSAFAAWTAGLSPRRRHSA